METSETIDRIFQRLEYQLRNMSPWAKRILAPLLLLLIALLDYRVSGEFSIFYLVPVVFAAEAISFGAAEVMALLCATTWGFLDVVATAGPVDFFAVLWNALIRLSFFILAALLIERNRKANIQAHVFASTDSLTGTANARVFTEELERTIARQRRQHVPFTLVYLDLDHFKDVNDGFGHPEGDAVLLRIAEDIRGEIRSTDMLARLGGDEFGLLMPETSGAQAKLVLQRIRALLQYQTELNHGAGATFGAVTFQIPPTDASEAIATADHLMYRGKHHRGSILAEDWTGPTT
jgi:diguanylate cyclase (GGDEF)-like protein